MDVDVGLILLVLIALVIGIVLKPAVALVVAGIVVFIAGLATLLPTTFGVSFGISGVVWGLALAGFGRLIAFVEQLLYETRMLRKDIATLRSTPVEVLDPIEVELRREVRAVKPPTRSEPSFSPAEIAAGYSKPTEEGWFKKSGVPPIRRP